MVRTRSTNYSPLVNEVTSNSKQNGFKTPKPQSKLAAEMNGSSILKRNIPESKLKHEEAESNDEIKHEMKNTLRRKVSYDANALGKTDSTVYLVFFSLLLDLMAFTMILPLLPSLLDHYRLNDKGGLYHWLSLNVKSFQERIGAPEQFNSVLFGGVLGSMFSFLQFIASPIVGGLSDVYGRKRIMLICLVGISLSYLLWIFSHNFTLFVLARFVGGISKGNISLAMAVISDVSNQNNRGKGMALVGIAFSLGFIMGPIIGAAFSLWSDKSSLNWYIYPAVFAFILSIADLLFVIFCLKETLPKEQRSHGVALSLSRASSFILVTDLFRFKAVENILWTELNELKKLGHIYFVYLFIYSGLEFTVTFLTHNTFGFTSMQQGKMFFVIGVIMAILQGGVVRRLPPKSIVPATEFGLWIIPISFACVALSSVKDIAVFGSINAIHFLYIGLFLYAVSTAFVVSCLTTLVSQIGGADQRGVTLGVFRSLGALARALGPVIASFAYWSFGAFATYMTGAVCLLYPVLALKHFYYSKND